MFFQNVTVIVNIRLLLFLRIKPALLCYAKEAVRITLAHSSPAYSAVYIRFSVGSDYAAEIRKFIHNVFNPEYGPVILIASVSNSEAAV